MGSKGNRKTNQKVNRFIKGQAIHNSVTKTNKSARQGWNKAAKKDKKTFTAVGDKQVWKRDERFLQREVAPMIVGGLQTALMATAPPVGIYANPLFDASKSSLRNNNLKAFKALGNARKYGQKMAWGSLEIIPVPLASNLLRGGIESSIHGNSKYLKNAAIDAPKDFLTGQAVDLAL